MRDNRNPSMNPIPNQQQIYYTNSEVRSPDTYGMTDNPSIPPQFSYMPPMNDFTVFEAQPQSMSEDVEFADYEDYNDYNHQIATLNYGMQHHHQYVHKY